MTLLFLKLHTLNIITEIGYIYHNSEHILDTSLEKKDQNYEHDIRSFILSPSRIELLGKTRPLFFLVARLTSRQETTSLP